MKQRIEEAEQRLAAADVEQERVDALCALSYLLRNNDNARAQHLAEEAGGLAMKSSYELGIAESEYVQGVVATCNAVHELALVKLFNSLHRFQHCGSKHGEMRSLRWLGIVYVRISMHTTAAEYFAKSRVLSEELGEVFHEAQCLNNIGDVHFGLNDFKTALGYYREAMRMFERFDEPEQQSVVLYSIGAAYLELEEYSKALLYFQQSLAIRREQNDTMGVGTSLAGIADTYARQGQTAKALEIFFEVLDKATEHSYTLGISWVNWSIGNLYLQSGKGEKALEYLIQSESMVGERTNTVLGAELTKSLAQCYKHLGAFERALAYFERFHEIREQTALQDNKQAISFLQRGFEMEKAQKEAEIYRLKTVELAQAHKQTEDLLLNILPEPIALRLKSGETTIADSFDEVTVLFADIVGFTQLSTQVTAEYLVRSLDTIFSQFDELAHMYGLEKIKTIGDAYMVVSGIPDTRADHCEVMARFALDMLDFTRQHSYAAALALPQLSVRIGMHTGPAVAGVIGKRKFSYDLWGDTVNTASRMESHGEAGRIHCSEAVAHKLQCTSRVQFLLEERGTIEIKGKGMMNTYFLTA